MTYWVLLGQWINSTVFFHTTARYFPDATTVYLEATSIDRDVRDLLRAHTESGLYIPGNGWFGKRQSNRRYRCKFSADLLDGLARLSENHAEPEICDHIHVYHERIPLLEFYDFPSNEIVISITVPEDRVRAFARALGVEYQKRDDG